MTIGWAEIGSTDGVSVISAPGGEYYPTDTEIATSLTIDPASGTLLWTRSDSYRNGSMLSINSNGALVQTADGSFSAASMSMDQSTGIVTATITEGGGD